MSILVVQHITTSEGSGGTTHDERKEVKEHLLVVSMKKTKREYFIRFFTASEVILSLPLLREVFSPRNLITSSK